VRNGRDRHLLDDLAAFLEEHRLCGDLDSAVETERVWMTRTCGAVINRSADDDWPGTSRLLQRAAALVQVATFG
jgi:hypothetical protein